MSAETDLLQRILQMRLLGRSIIAHTDRVAEDLPDDVVVEALLMVAVARAQVAGLDMDKLVKEFAKVASHKPEEEA
jgi:hypothetical protein